MMIIDTDSDTIVNTMDCAIYYNVTLQYTLLLVLMVWLVQCAG